MANQFQAGFVNIFGPPNAGKSTLLNQLLGEQLVITSHKVQTTRHRILGFLND
jgi:GTP-binding protein Era